MAEFDFDAFRKAAYETANCNERAFYVAAYIDSNDQYSRRHVVECKGVGPTPYVDILSNSYGAARKIEELQEEIDDLRRALSIARAEGRRAAELDAIGRMDG